MTTATVRITTSTREQLRELAEQTGKSMQALMGEAVAAYRRRLPGKVAQVRRNEIDLAEAYEILAEDQEGNDVEIFFSAQAEAVGD